MKTELILGSFLAFATITNAQVWTTGTGKETTPGKVGIGTTAPAYKLDVVFTNNAGEGVRIQNKGYDGEATLRLDNKTTGPGGVFGAGGGHEYAFFSMGYGNTYPGSFELWDYTTASSRLFIGSNGNVGFGKQNPTYKLELNTSALNDGININQTGTDAAALHLTNQSTGGRHWGVFSTGSGNTQGAGHFIVHEYNSIADRLFIQGVTGNVGIGTSNPTNKLHVIEDQIQPMVSKSAGLFEMKITSQTAMDQIGVTGKVSSPVSDAGTLGIGVLGLANLNEGDAVIGVQGDGNGTVGWSYGGVMWGRNNYAGSNAYSYGLSAYAETINGTAWGVEADASATGSGSALAGKFWGTVEATAYTTPSDRHLKENVKPLTNAMDKLKLLKPSTYVYKTSEFKTMRLPEGEQIGLIAQELEEVFPELIRENKNVSTPGNNDKKERQSIPDYKTVNYMGLIPVLISGIQEQQVTIEQQNTRLLDQEMELKEQKQLISELQKRVGISASLQETNDINEFKMDQNEPNPFNGKTTIRYSIPQSVGIATLFVYDLTGKQIATLPINEKGSSSVTLTSENLAAGIYIYSIVADGKIVDSKRMVVAEK